MNRTQTPEYLTDKHNKILTRFYQYSEKILIGTELISCWMRGTNEYMFNRADRELVTSLIGLNFVYETPVVDSGYLIKRIVDVYENKDVKKYKIDGLLYETPIMLFKIETVTNVIIEIEQIC